MGSTSGGGAMAKCTMAKKLHENHKINIFGAKLSGDMGVQANFLGSGMDSPVLHERWEVPFL